MTSQLSYSSKVLQSIIIFIFHAILKSLLPPFTYRINSKPRVHYCLKVVILYHSTHHLFGSFPHNTISDGGMYITCRLASLDEWLNITDLVSTCDKHVMLVLFC